MSSEMTKIVGIIDPEGVKGTDGAGDIDPDGLEVLDRVWTPHPEVFLSAPDGRDLLCLKSGTQPFRTR